MSKPAAISTSIFAAYLPLNYLESLPPMLYVPSENSSPPNSSFEQSRLLKNSSTLFTSENCHSNTRIRAFLRLSRLASDDTIKEHLNETTPEKCADFFSDQLLPHWQARAKLIQFCSDEAAALRRNVKLEESTLSTNIDLTIDPYAVKDAKQKLQERYSESEAIENWVNNEQSVETIIQKHSVDVLNQRCMYRDWLLDFHIAVNQCRKA